jgi:hypothetical protein
VKRSTILAAVVAAVIVLPSCMEVEQTATPSRQGKYQGKPDTKPWENTPLAYESAKWSKGDRAAWEEQIKKRQFGQHEHNRIYQ